MKSNKPGPSARRLGEWRICGISAALVALAACGTADGERKFQPDSMVEEDSGIIGLDQLAVQKLLGEPGLVRREAPAEIWQYRHAGCVLDLFLYREKTGSRVLHAEARTLDAKPTATKACIDALLDDQPSDLLQS